MNRVDPLREGSGESLSSQVSQTLPASWKFRKIFRKNSIDISGLAIALWHFMLQKMPAHIEAARLHAVGVSHVKLLIFQPQSERTEVGLGAAAPGEVGSVLIEGKKRRIVVAIEGPPRSSRFAENIHKRQRQGEEADCKGEKAWASTWPR